MSNIDKVTGQECLNYIDRALCFGNREKNGTPALPYPDLAVSVTAHNEFLESLPVIATRLLCFSHDTSKRKVGYVRKKYDDGGLEVCILGNETLSSRGEDGFRLLEHRFTMNSYQKYRYNVETTRTERQDDPPYPTLPSYEEMGGLMQTSGKVGIYQNVRVGGSVTERFVPFDEAIDFKGELLTANSGNLGAVWEYQGHSIINTYRFDLTDNGFNTLVFGVGSNDNIRIDKEAIYNPLSLCGGNLYSYGTFLSVDFHAQTPAWFDTAESFNDYFASTGVLCNNYNLVSIPYNLILTDVVDYALAYLSNGVLPPDAYLYPLDLDNLPIYNPPDDDGTDGDDDNTPNDTDRDITPNPPVVPSFTPSMLTNNNFYWLTAPQLSDFISWYWNDVGSVSDFDDLIDKIAGLYNNLSEAILTIRFFPVEIDWIGGYGIQENIKIAQIEKNGLVDTIAKTPNPQTGATGKLKVIDVGSVHIPNKYNSFLDLSPYSQISLYLPYHGFIDLDINIFSGHDIYVKAIYDYMSGTIQYLLYYDNQFLVTSLVCKMAMDIPVSLQTKNDRDSAIFQNVSNTISGLLGAGMSLGTGNPMGLLIGANAFNSGIATAPLNVKGNVGEMGAFYAPPQCAIILRRPTVSKPSQDIWKARVGQVCGLDYTLANLKGYTTVYNPQINFKGNTNFDGIVMKPLESEIQEIYDLLEKGVIL